MLISEFKAYGKETQFAAIDEAIRTFQFIQNKGLRFWIDNKGVSRYDLNKYSAVLAKEFPFADKLNSMARIVWLGNQPQKELSLPFLAFTITVKRK